MKNRNRLFATLFALFVTAQAFTADSPARRGNEPPDGAPTERRAGFDGPPPFGPGGPGGVQQEVKLVKRFDQDGDKRLNAAERKVAREFIAKEKAEGRGRRGPRGPGFPGRNEQQEPPRPGPKLSPADVKSFPDAPLYDPRTLRTLFLEFENADWEMELADFNNTDVEVPVKLTVDGRTYRDVGVHFRGMSSFGMVGEGRKRSLNLSLDFVHESQQLGGYRTLNLLNSHEDPTFLRTVLYYQIAREYIPAPKANYVRVVINGESWGVYVNVQQFNKDFVKDFFDTTKGARWKVPGSPGGRGGLAYLGDDVRVYKRVYDIRTKDDQKSWADFIRLCKVLNETSPDRLPEALAPLLDVDGALKFLALENVFINNDGYWVRASDYSIYQDEKGRFHILPQDANETFLLPGGPGIGPGPGSMLAAPIVAQADRNGDGKLTKEEFTALAGTWFDKLDPKKEGKLSQDQFTRGLSGILPPPPGPGPFGEEPPGGEPRPSGRPGGFDPGRFLGQGIFAAADADKNGALTRGELGDTFAKWFGEWDSEKAGALDEDKVGRGFSAVLPAPGFARVGGGPGGPGGPGGGRGPGGPGFGGGPRVNGVELDPLFAANDTNKPLLSKLLAVPSLRARYLGFVRDIAQQWLDWNKLGPLAAQYQALIADDVKVDTRKLYSWDAFVKGVTEEVEEPGIRGPRRTISLKSFVEQRRAFLLKQPEKKRAGL